MKKLEKIFKEYSYIFYILGVLLLWKPIIKPIYERLKSILIDPLKDANINASVNAATNSSNNIKPPNGGSSGNSNGNNQQGTPIATWNIMAACDLAADELQSIISTDEEKVVTTLNDVLHTKEDVDYAVGYYKTIGKKRSLKADLKSELQSDAYPDWISKGLRWKDLNPVIRQYVQ